MGRSAQGMLDGEGEIKEGPWKSGEGRGVTLQPRASV